jgi:di/tricarboxylate transporter
MFTHSGYDRAVSPEILVLVVLLGAVVLFVVDRWRYDLVALAALLTLAVTGVIPANQVFSGFGHSAVITVAAILMVSAGLASSGVVDRLARVALRFARTPVQLVVVLTSLVTLASAFMNNVGALALFLPVAVRAARETGTRVSIVLMPLAFGSLLGGMTTLVGTPPNLLISAERERLIGKPFGMFDFSPAGSVVAIAGVAFISLLGWRLLPRREGGSREELLRLQEYSVELRVPPGSTLVGKDLRALREFGTEVVVVSLVRGDERFLAPARNTRIAADDRLISEIDPRKLEEFLDLAGLELAGSKKLGTEGGELESEQVSLVEAVVRARSILVGSTAVEVGLRDRHGVNLLAVSRAGARLTSLLRDVRFEPGDVILIQCRTDHLPDALASLTLLPLADRRLELGSRRRPLLAIGIFGAAIGALVAGLVSAEVAFVTAAFLMVVTGVLPLREAYRAVEWPVLVLLGAMIPVGGALESSGAAATLARHLVDLGESLPIWAVLTIVLVVTMMLSDAMNNAATAVLMAPVAAGVAHGLGASPDAFLMAVALGASSAFLTPIGHQSNTLVMGPGGYRFGDYWRMGLPLEIVIVALGVPTLLIVWPP